MNYRHIFHAGNICDTVKHAALTLLVGHLRGKPKSFCVIDTHAGAGIYDLHDPRAQKTAEAQAGIYKLLAADPVPELAGYVASLRKLNPGWNPEKPETFRFYPGSPLLVCHLLRPQDRLAACELHEDDARALRLVLGQHRQAQVHCRDGYEALGGFLPPLEKRGLVLIDPPYEKTGEFDRLSEIVIQACRRWPQGMFMLWYPVKERPAIWKFHERLAASGIAEILCAEFIFEEETRHDRLNGGGHIFINPPWRLGEELKTLFPVMHKAMQTRHQGDVITWLTRG